MLKPQLQFRKAQSPKLHFCFQLAYYLWTHPSMVFFQLIATFLDFIGNNAKETLPFAISQLGVSNELQKRLKTLAVESLLTSFPLCLFLKGSSQDRKQRTHKPEGCGSGWIRCTVQDQEADTAHQTDEGVLWETGGPGRVDMQRQMLQNTSGCLSSWSWPLTPSLPFIYNEVIFAFAKIDSFILFFQLCKMYASFK